jgi:hypothetical protein
MFARRKDVIGCLSGLMCLAPYEDKESSTSQRKNGGKFLMLWYSEAVICMGTITDSLFTGEGEI